MNQKDYQNLVQQHTAKSPLLRDASAAFLSGGTICCLGQLLHSFFLALGSPEESASIWTSISLIFLSVALTAFGSYDKIAKFAGGGTLVPITGFANSVASPALEFKAEGFVTGAAARIFTVAGPVIVFGVGSSVIYGLILSLF